jgi:pimeloyl-ACP methyl ester carboxylesterase
MLLTRQVALALQFLVPRWQPTRDNTCGDRVHCIHLEANGFLFDCRISGPPQGEAVMLLHGFPEWSEAYVPLMRLLAENGFRALACNQRGYSPAASPENPRAYHTNALTEDVFALAAAANVSKFHLVGHDHGALLGWRIAAKRATQVLSYTALSVPHVDAFSQALVSDSSDLDQIMASQYMTMFVEPNSASKIGQFWFELMGRGSYDSGFGTYFHTADAFQKALYWYIGAMSDNGSGMLATPPRMTASSLLRHGDIVASALRALWGGSADAGRPAAHPIGPVNVTTLFVCGADDPTVLCTRPWARRTKGLITGEYRALTVDKCGHQLLSCPQADAVYDSIIAHLLKSRERDLPAPTTA